MATIKIAAAAVKVGDVIHRGTRHGLIMQEIWQQELDRGGDLSHISQECQGFVTDKGDFVSREAAAVIALEARQIPRRLDLLTSEDVW